MHDNERAKKRLALLRVRLESLMDDWSFVFRGAPLVSSRLVLEELPLTETQNRVTHVIRMLQVSHLFSLIPLDKILVVQVHVTSLEERPSIVAFPSELKNYPFFLRGLERLLEAFAREMNGVSTIYRED